MKGLDGEHPEHVRSDDLSDAPVPDLPRLARATLSRREVAATPDVVEASTRPAGAVELELWGPPAAILSLARWLRTPSEDVVPLAGSRRDGWEPGPSTLALDVGGDAAEAAGVAVRLDGDRCTLAGTPDALEALARVLEDVGVHALDLRWAPVERRRVLAAPLAGDHPEEEDAVLAAGSPTVTVASAYPLDPVEDDGAA